MECSKCSLKDSRVFRIGLPSGSFNSPETHLTTDERFNHPDFRTYRLDRSDGRRGGGVAVVVRIGLSHRLLPCPRTSVIESIAVELYVFGRRLVVASVYFPGSNDPRVLSL